MKIAAAGVLILAIVVLGAGLALAPFHHVHTADECRAAYAKARTHADTVAVDFKPLRDGDGRLTRRQRCMSVRGVHAVSSLDVLSR